MLKFPYSWYGLSVTSPSQILGKRPSNPTVTLSSHPNRPIKDQILFGGRRSSKPNPSRIRTCIGFLFSRPHRSRPPKNLSLHLSRSLLFHNVDHEQEETESPTSRHPRHVRCSMPRARPLHVRCRGVLSVRGRARGRDRRVPGLPIGPHYVRLHRRVQGLVGACGRR